MWIFFLIDDYNTVILLHRQAFFTDLKCQIRRGDIHIPNYNKPSIGARLAQAEMGDIDESQGMLYPPYFPSWNSGIAHIIRKEHKKLKGTFRFSEMSSGEWI